MNDFKVVVSWIEDDTLMALELPRDHSTTEGLIAFLENEGYKHVVIDITSGDCSLDLMTAYDMIRHLEEEE